MKPQSPDSFDQRRALVIGAGIGGLACAMRLQASGMQVILLDRHDTPGGKMRTVPSVAGPVDAGPTVLTMRPVFEDLFAATGSRLADHVTLIRQDILARHFWPDGSQLDLYDDPVRSAEAINAFAGPRARSEFQRFFSRTEALFDTFEAPMIHAPEPAKLTLAAQALRKPRLLAELSPTASLSKRLSQSFSDPRLAQLFGRYATYVGGSPYESPALLSLIWQAEARGVWVVKGGMHVLAQAMAQHFCAMGGQLRLGSHVRQITTENGRATGISLDTGEQITAPLVIFNGDPRALATGAMGPDVAHIAPMTRQDARSLSARVWSFAAQVDGPDLVHHNVFFTADPKAEFDALRAGKMYSRPTLYLCAEDRGDTTQPATDTVERFEIILNAAPLTQGTAPADEATTCRNLTFQTLEAFGLRFAPTPDITTLTTPSGFDQLFPETAGSLYGQSPHGLTAALRRPRARTAVQGLYLVGGGAHPGAGVPMATLSARHAAEAIMQDHALT